MANVEDKFEINFIYKKDFRLRFLTKCVQIASKLLIFNQISYQLGCFIVVNTAADGAKAAWVIINWVPDDASAKSKMVNATSSRELKKNLKIISGT